MFLTIVLTVYIRTLLKNQAPVVSRSRTVLSRIQIFNKKINFRKSYIRNKPTHTTQQNFNILKTGISKESAKGAGLR